MVVASIGGTAAEAAPKPKPWKQTYGVFLPQPWAVASPGAADCKAAPDGLSKASRSVSLPAKGRLGVGLSGYVGDWAVEVYDAKGALLASSSGIGGGQLIALKHKGGKQAYRVAVCNYAGGPNGTVTVTYTPG